MGKALSTSTRVASSPATLAPLPALDELYLASSSWVDDRLAFADAKESGELSALFATAERIAAPLPKSVATCEPELRHRLTAPATREDALRVVTTAMAALASGNEDGDFAFDAYMEHTLASQYSIGDLELAKHWLHTPPGHDPERPDFRLFRFKPSPAEWIELCDEARDRHRGMLRSLEQKKALQSEANALLARRPELEAEEAVKAEIAKNQAAEFWSRYERERKAEVRVDQARADLLDQPTRERLKRIRSAHGY